MDLAIINAHLYTVNPAQPLAEACLIKNDKIDLVGSNQEIKALINNKTTVIDAQNRLVLPGFIDSHVHFVDGGLQLLELNLRGCQSKEEFRVKVKQAVQEKPAGAWIYGSGWDHELWGGFLPDLSWIDDLSSQHPIILFRVDGHLCLLNSTALKIAGLNPNSVSPPGGIIMKDSHGKLSGILKDKAIESVTQHIADPGSQALNKAIKAAGAYTASLGVTSVHNMSLFSYSDYYNLKNAYESGDLKTRVHCTFSVNEIQEAIEINQSQAHNNWLRAGGIKVFTDGSLGAHTAAFMKPYLDQPDNSGMLIYPEEEINRLIHEIDQAKLQLMIHAIGDKAVHICLNSFERMIEQNASRDRRFRIEHAQHLLPQDIARFSKLDIIASMQPAHILSEGWAEKALGSERLKTAYAFRSLLDQQAKLVFGSDWFVTTPDPIQGIYAAVNRITSDGRYPDGFVPEQKIAIHEAIKAYSIDAAYSVFEENIKGSIARGKLADLVILNQNLFDIHPSEIEKVKIDMSIIGGEIVYQK